MASYNVQKFLNVFFSRKELKLFKKTASKMLTTSEVLFNYTPKFEGAYTRVMSTTKLGKPIFRMTIGGNMVSKIADLPGTFPNAAVARTYYNPIHWSFVGLFFHEMGHLCYTDMVDDSIIKYKDKDYIGFIHTLFNVLEDVYIEKFALAINFPITKKYFAYLTQQIFEPKCSSYSDRGDASSLINFLLLKLRCPKKLTAHNAVFDSVSSTILPMISDILHEPDGKTRITKTISLAEWLIANTSLDYKMPEPDLDKVTSGGVGGVPVGSAPTGKTSPTTPTLSSSGGTSTSSSTTPPTPGSNSGGSSNDRGSDSPRGELPDFTTVKDLEDAAEEEVEDLYDPANDLLIDNCSDIDDSFNSTLSEADPLSHHYLVAKEHFLYTNAIKQAIDERMAKMNPVSMQVIKAIKLFKGQIRPRPTAGFKSGKLHLPTAIKSANSGLPTTDLFSRKVARGQAADLAISILCDNSGSMSGNKSRVCTRAMLALAQACEAVDVPIEVNCFTETCGINYTIKMKTFEEKFSEAKYYFGITDADVYHKYSYDGDYMPLFHGNEDEVNLYWVWKDLMKNCKHKDKLIFVISDGETCGSSDDLRNLVKQIKASGVKIIGLGIQSRAVSTLYPEYKLFDTVESLNGLPDFLVDTLNSLIRGGK